MTRLARWIPASALAAIIFLGLFFWAKRETNAEHDAQRRLETEKPSEPEPGIAAAGSPYVPGPPMAVRTSSGEPMIGVKVYAGWPEGGLELEGTTDERGRVQLGTEPLRLGLAPDGRMAVSVGGANLVFGATDNLRLRVISERGRAVAGKTISLLPDAIGAPLKSLGTVRGARQISSSLASRLTSKTDSSGFVDFSNLPSGVPFKVSADFDGDRCVEFDGSVVPGRSADVHLALQREVRGQVTHATTGAPIAGAEVHLMDNLHPYLGDTSPSLRTAITNGKGTYRFTELPNCAFRVVLGDSIVNGGKRALVSAKVGDRQWTGWEYLGRLPDDVPLVDVHLGAKVALRHPATTCNFRSVTASLVKVALFHPRLGSFQGYSIGAFDSASGAATIRESGDAGSTTLVLAPGRHTLWISRFGEQGEHVFAKADLREGEEKQFSVRIPSRFALRPLAQGYEAQSPGSKMYDFRVLGSDQRTYDMAALTSRKPVLLVNLEDWEGARVFSDLNRLHLALAGKVRLVGVVHGGPRELARLRSKYRLRFLVLGGSGPYYSPATVITQISTGRLVCTLGNTLLLPNGHTTHV